MTAPLRHGYYLAAAGTRHGDPSLAAMAENLWQISPCRDFDRTHAGRYDGVSVFVRATGETVQRLVVRDLFAETFRVAVRDSVGGDWVVPL